MVKLALTAPRRHPPRCDIGHTAYCMPPAYTTSRIYHVPDNLAVLRDVVIEATIVYTASLCPSAVAHSRWFTFDTVVPLSVKDTFPRKQ
jgi:hypothetical protein